MDERPDDFEVRGIARRRLLAVAGGAALAFLLAGCKLKNGNDGGGGDGGTGNTGGTSNTGTTGGTGYTGTSGTSGTSGGVDSGGDDTGGDEGGDEGGGDEVYRSHQVFGDKPG